MPVDHSSQTARVSQASAGGNNSAAGLKPPSPFGRSEGDAGLLSSDFTKKQSVSFSSTIQKRASSPVVQRKLVSAGFNKMAGGGREDTLVTSSLGNCIAIVAWDPVKQLAVLAHYDTQHSSMQDLAFEVGAFERFKEKLLNGLRQIGSTAGEDMIEFRIGLGLVWAAQSQARQLARSRLCASLLSAFGVLPAGNGATMTFAVENGTLTIAGGAAAEELDKAWDQHSGVAIDYNE